MQESDDAEIKAQEIWRQAHKDRKLRNALRHTPLETLMGMGIPEDEARVVIGKVVPFLDGIEGTGDDDPTGDHWALKYPWRGVLGR